VKGLITLEDYIITWKQIMVQNADYRYILGISSIIRTFLFRKFYLSSIGDDESSDEDNVEDDFEEELIEAHGILTEQHEKPDDLLDNYFLPGDDEFEVQHPFYPAR